MRTLQRHTTTILLIIFFVSIFTATVFIQKAYDAIVHPEVIYNEAKTKYILPAPIVKNFSFGFKNIIADMYWLNSIQDLPEWNHKDQFYVDQYRNLATLDPKFSYPYIFGILTVSSKFHAGSVEMIEPVTVLGIESLPYNWEIPYYLGVQFNVSKNREKALEYFEIAATRPLIPDLVRSVYRSYKKNILKESDSTRAFIKTIYETTESKTTKKIIKEGMVLSDMAQIVKNVSEKYKIKYGVYPSSLEELIEKKMIQITPGLKEEFEVVIDKNTGDVTIIPKK